MTRLIFISLFTFLNTAFGAPDGHRVTQHMALEFNTAIMEAVENKPYYLKQYFVPESWAQILYDPSVSDWQRFARDPERTGWVRVLVHPFDRVTAEKIEAELEKAGISVEESFYQEPLRVTESRSLYPENLLPNSVPVSPRLSMTHGLGPWFGQEPDDHTGERKYEYTKLISAAQAKFSYVASNLIQQKISGVKGHFFQIQPERMVVTIKSPTGTLNLGETFRDISSSVKEGTYAYPSFIGQHTRAGFMLALLNNKESFYEYLRDVEAPIRGRALAEFFARTGFVHSSPHSQNFLIETNELFRPTGLLNIRDLPDLIPTLDARLADPEMAKLFENFADARAALREELDGGEKHFRFRHSFFKGGHSRHYSNDQMETLEESVSKSFVTALAEMSGVPVETLETIVTRDLRYLTLDYANTLFKRDTKVWSDVLSGLSRYRLNSKPFGTKKLETKSEKIIWDRKTDRVLKYALKQKLKGQQLSANMQAQISNLWKNRSQYRPTQEQTNFLASVMIAIDLMPSGERKSIFENLSDQSRNHTQQKILKELFLNNLTSLTDEEAKIDFLKELIKISDMKMFEHESREVFQNISNCIRHAKSPALIEAGYFAMLAFDKYPSSAALEMFEYIKKTGQIPEAVQKNIRMYLKSNPEKENWIFEKVLKAKPIRLSLGNSPNLCPILF